MRKSILTLILAVVAITATHAQYYDNDPIGTKYYYETSNKLMDTIKTIYTLTAVDGNTLTFDVESGVPGSDKTITSQSVMTFADGKIILDAESVITQVKSSMGQAAEGADMDIELEGDPDFTPLEGKVGDKLPLTKMTMKMKVQGTDVVTTIEQLQSEITAEEEVTTPAGTFNTFKLEQKLSIITKVVGMDQKMKQSATYWIEPNKGVVKSTTSTMGMKMNIQLVKVERP